MKNRRDILRNAGAVSLVAGAGPLLQACASAPSAPEPPPKPVALLGMLPVGPEAVAPADSGRAMGGPGPRAQVGVNVGVDVPVVVPSRPYLGRNDLAVAAGLLIGFVIVGAVVAVVHDAVQGGEAKVQPIDMNIVALLNERLLAQLRARRLSVLSLAEPTLAREIRSRNTQAVPPEVDAILDVKVVEAFFATSWRSSGYSPTLNVSAIVKDPRAGMDEVIGHTYYADNRDWGRQRRQFTMPENLTFARAADIRANAALVRQGLDSVIDRMVGLIADDVERHCAGLPQV